MRLRPNEFCPIHRSLWRETLPKPQLIKLGVRRVEDPPAKISGAAITRRDAETLEPQSAPTSWNMCDLPRKSSPTTTTSFQTIRISKEWAEPREMIIRTISRQHIGGITEKKDQPEWMTDSRSAGIGPRGELCLAAQRSVGEWVSW
jgi:hypothetical protein